MEPMDAPVRAVGWAASVARGTRDCELNAGADSKCDSDCGSKCDLGCELDCDLNAGSWERLGRDVSRVRLDVSRVCPSSPNSYGQGPSS